MCKVFAQEGGLQLCSTSTKTGHLHPKLVLGVDYGWGSSAGKWDEQRHLGLGALLPAERVEETRARWLPSSI